MRVLCKEGAGGSLSRAIFGYLLPVRTVLESLGSLRYRLGSFLEHRKASVYMVSEQVLVGKTNAVVCRRMGDNGGMGVKKQGVLWRSQGKQMGRGPFRSERERESYARRLVRRPPAWG